MEASKLINAVAQVKSQRNKMIKSSGSDTKSKEKRQFNPREIIDIVGHCGKGAHQHDYLNCKQCKVDKSRKCDIFQCPCNGEGILIPTNFKYSFSHQLQLHSKSVKVDLRRPKQSKERILKVISYEMMLASKNSNE